MLNQYIIMGNLNGADCFINKCGIKDSDCINFLIVLTLLYTIVGIMGTGNIDFCINDAVCIINNGGIKYTDYIDITSVLTIVSIRGTDIIDLYINDADCIVNNSYRISLFWVHAVCFYT